MAKIKTGLAIAAISGKIGGVTYSTNSDGAHARSQSNQCKPRSQKQREVTSKFTSATQAWRGLTDSNRLTWKSLAISLGKKSLAFRLYVHYYLEALHAGFTPSDTAPAPGSGFRVSLPRFSITRSPDLLEFIYNSSIPVNGAVMIFATPPMSVGIEFSLKGERLIRVAAFGDTSPVDLTSNYIATFGAMFPIGSQIGIRVHSIPTEPGAGMNIGRSSSIHQPDNTAGSELAKILK